MKRKIIKMLSVMMAAVFIIVGINIPVVNVNANSKSSYLKSYKKLEKKCKKKFTYSGSQAEMNKESYEEYKLWDKELNKDYKMIKKNLSPKKAKKLVASERKWIKKRDKKAKKDAAEWEGGSGYPMVYNISLIEQTKSRIKWLIKNYA
ncbi:MAG: DUF1311 domain-containing protein [Lachnospiraceae bacterium]|nr:DUF1311 domain-containing protein [Lachnospiraceae bacterium]